VNKVNLKRNKTTRAQRCAMFQQTAEESLHFVMYIFEYDRNVRAQQVIEPFTLFIITHHPLERNPSLVEETFAS